MQTCPSNEHEVADVNDQRGRLAEDDDGIAAEDAVDRHQQSAGKGEIPERDRHVTDLAPLGSDPLHEESGGKEGLRDEAECGEQVPVPGARIVRVHRYPSCTRYVSTRFDIQRTATQSARPRKAR